MDTTSVYFKMKGLVHNELMHTFSTPRQTNKPKRIAKLLAAMRASYFRLRLQ